MYLYVVNLYIICESLRLNLQKITKTMKKTFFFLQLIFLSISTLFAQLPANAIAPNFTVSDLNGNTHSLYDYLNQGKTVYIDFSASYCPTCWGYHNTHALKNLYEQHGPNGTLSQDVMVLFVEIYGPSTDDNVRGIGGNTQGDWTAGTPYPISNPAGQALTDIKSLFAVNYYPMIYAICPDKTTTLIGTLSSENLYAHVATCATTTAIEPTLSANIKVFPNPSEGVFTLEIPDFLENMGLDVYNSLGEKVYESLLMENKTEFSLAHLSKGMYYLCLSDGRKTIIVRQ